MFIPGFLISMITFPGVIVHEFAHQLFCRLYKITVFKVVYFQVGNPSGYVLHEKVSNKWQAMMISVGPFVVNTVLGFLIALPASLPLLTAQNNNPLHYILLYLGVSIAMHAFPSTGDAAAILQDLKEESTSVWVKLVGYPVIGLIYLGALGSFFWLDAIYGFMVAIGLPKLIVDLSV